MLMILIYELPNTAARKVTASLGKKAVHAGVDGINNVIGGAK